MPDYKSLFYKSQAEIADSIEILEALSLKLIKCMQYCEDNIIEENDFDKNKKTKDTQSN